MHVIPGSVEHFSLPDPDAAHLHGPRVMFAIVQAYQLILRKQIEALRKYIPGEPDFLPYTKELKIEKKDKK